MRRQKAKHNYRRAIIFALLTAALLSCALVGFAFAKYIKTDASNSFDLFIAARYYVSFNSGEGQITSPSAVSAPWTALTEKTATKICTVGQPYGELPVAERTGYDFVSWGKSLVNSGYQPVEYIESKGSSYINLDWNPKGKTDISISTKFVITTDVWGCLFGSGDDGLSVWCNCAVQPTRMWHHVCKTGNICEFSSIPKNAIHEYRFEYHNGTLQTFLDGKSSNLQTGLNGEFLDTTLAVMAGHYGNAFSNRLAGKLYAFSISEGDEKVIDLVPCRTIAEGKASVYGMYDTVNGRFYPSDSATAFTGGEDLDFSGADTKVLPEDLMLKATDHAISAIWKPKVFTLTLNAGDETSKYKAEGNTPDGTFKVTYDSKYNLPTLTRIGHTFEGWHFDDEEKTECKPDDVVKILEDKTLTASWTANTYTVSFDAGEGSIDTESAEKTFGQPYGVLPSVTAPEGLALAGWTADDLPFGYKSLEYVQCTGTQYIDTGWSPYGKEDVTVKISASWSGSDWGVLFGAAKTSDNSEKPWFNCAMGNHGGNKIWNHVCESGDICQTTGIVQDKIYDVEFHYTGTGKSASLTETVTPEGQSPSSITYSQLNNNLADNSMYVMAGHYGSVMKFPFKGKIYAFSIYEGDKLVMNLVPSLSSDGKVGMYDTVCENPSAAFHESIGSASLIAGNTLGGDQELITSSTLMEIPYDHTLHAVYKPFSYNICFEGDYPEELEDINTIAAVEYIENVGRSYIDTGLVLNQDSKLIMDFTFTKIDHSFNFIFGARSKAGENEFELTATSDGSQMVIRDDYGNNNRVYTSHNAQIGELLHIVKDRNTLTLNGDLLAEHDAAEFNTSYTAVFFATNYEIIDAPGTVEYATGRLYGAEIWDGDALVRKYEPIYNRETGMYGLYDSVNDEYYYGDYGSFTGPNVNGVTIQMEYDEKLYLPEKGVRTPYFSSILSWSTEPDGEGVVYPAGTSVSNLTDTDGETVHLYPNYLEADIKCNGYQIEYIESNGNSAIDTGIVLNQDSKIVADFAFTQFDHNFNFIFGARTQAELNEYELTVTSSDGKMVLRDDYGVKANRIYTAYEPMLEEKLHIVKEGNTLTVNDNLLATHTVVSLDTTYTCTIFDTHYGNLNYGESAVGRLYAFKLWKDGELVRDFIPFYNTDENAAGLYDVVSEEFFKSISSTPFIAGPK